MPMKFAILAIAMLLTTSVNAALLQFNFTGTKTNDAFIFPGISFGGKTVGETFSGSLTLNTQALSITDSPITKHYLGQYFDLIIEGYSMNVTHFIVRSESYDGIRLNFSDERTNSLGVLSLSSTSNIYNDTSIPTSFNINDFDRTSYIVIQGGDLLISEEGTIDTLHAVVPIPAAAWLFSTGLMGILFVGRRRLSNSSL